MFVHPVIIARDGARADIGKFANMRIAQMIIAPVVQASLVEVDTLDDTARGSGGFGSTGTDAPAGDKTGPA